MKFFTTHLTELLKQPELRKNLPLLLKYIVVLALVVVAFGVGFHFIMALEGKEHTWFTGVYWALTVMSTLGFGDITFHSDLGRGFSILVLLTGVIMLLIVLPFAFIRFFLCTLVRGAAQHKSAAKSAGGDLRSRNHMRVWSDGPLFD